VSKPGITETSRGVADLQQTAQSRPTECPIDPRADWAGWKALLAEAGVRDARLHDARHTAATLLLVQGVNARTVMDIMGWTEARMLSRYQHVVDELRRDAADRMGQALWPDAKLRLAETRTETKDQHRRTRKASDLENTRSEAPSWSRLSESNRRPTHYEVEDRRSGLDQ